MGFNGLGLTRFRGRYHCVSSHRLFLHEQADKDLRVANQAFPRHEFQPSPGVSRHLPTDLLDAGRHLGAGVAMVAGKLIQVGNGVVADARQLDTFSLGCGLEKVSEIHNAKL